MNLVNRPTNQHQIWQLIAGIVEKSIRVTLPLRLLCQAAVEQVQAANTLVDSHMRRVALGKLFDVNLGVSLEYVSPKAQIKS